RDPDQEPRRESGEAGRAGTAVSRRSVAPSDPRARPASAREVMSTLVVHPLAGKLEGGVPVPSDKSIGHRALLFASLCEGVSTIRGFSYGEDNVSTANAM